MFSVTGICTGLSAGEIEVSIRTMKCTSFDAYSNYDVKTGYLATSRLIIEEVRLRDGTTDDIIHG